MAGIGQAGSIAEMGAMAGLSEFGQLSNWQERSSGDRVHLTTSAGLGIRAPAGCASGTAALHSTSSLSNQAHSSSAQMSATALLQKAAQMGATASNNPVLKGFGMAGSDSSSKVFGSSWPGLSQDVNRVGLPGMIPSLVQNHQSLMKRDPSVALGNMGSPSELGCEAARNTGNNGLHELLSSLPGATGISAGLGSLPTSFGPSREMGGGFLQGNGSTNERALTRDPVGQTSQLISQKPPFVGGFARLAKGEDGAADRFTRDFLGVGGVNSIVGAAGGMGRSIPHRDFASIVSAGIEQYNNSRENLRSVGVTNQSVGKHWDV